MAVRRIQTGRMVTTKGPAGPTIVTRTRCPTAHAGFPVAATRIPVAERSSTSPSEQTMPGVRMRPRRRRSSTFEVVAGVGRADRQ
jgi:hypothetical protein